MDSDSVSTPAAAESKRVRSHEELPPTGDSVATSTQTSEVDSEHPPKRLKGEHSVGTESEQTDADPADSRRALGRREYFRMNADRKTRSKQSQEASTVTSSATGSATTPTTAAPSTAEGEDSEKAERRPKRKVAVLIGYSGTGYKGMQIMPDQPTIEGDLFKAFVKAGAISEVNANDPKKSSLVRCARTDKGVHAAGNVVSLKLIVEDEDIMDRINAALPDQIRVWAIHRTLGSFSCYKACDSRWYEYLLPSHALLPPHPRSYLGKNILDLAAEVDDMDGYNTRQADAISFWEDVEKNRVRPIVDGLEPAVREIVEAALLNGVEDEAEGDSANPSQGAAEGEAVAAAAKEPVPVETQRAAEAAIRAIKREMYAAKAAYRISADRRARLQDALSQFEGTHNFHNYTIHKRATDPSAKRMIKSFRIQPGRVLVPPVANGAAEAGTEAHPIPVVLSTDTASGADPAAGTEWLSLKVHGQSFMMHQIRKMVSMAALVVRCGTPVDRIGQTFGTTPVSIPKAPGLGLLLERPVFDSYNSKLRATGRADRAVIEFGYGDGKGEVAPEDDAEAAAALRAKIDAFKQKYIYDHIFMLDSTERQFFRFFAHVDGYRDPYFLFLSSKGLDAVSRLRAVPTATEKDGGKWKKGNRKARDSGPRLGIESEDEAGVGEEDG